MGTPCGYGCLRNTLTRSKFQNFPVGVGGGGGMPPDLPRVLCGMCAQQLCTVYTHTHTPISTLCPSPFLNLCITPLLHSACIRVRDGGPSLHPLQGVLNSLKKPLLAIKGQDGFLIVFRKVVLSVKLSFLMLYDSSPFSPAFILPPFPSAPPPSLFFTPSSFSLLFPSRSHSSPLLPFSPSSFLYSSFPLFPSPTLSPTFPFPFNLLFLISLSLASLPFVFPIPILLCLTLPPFPPSLLSLSPSFLPSSLPSSLSSLLSSLFSQFDENVYLAVSQDEEDTEESLTRKLFVFNRIVTLLYGPVDSK